MTHYVLPDIRARIDYDKDTKELKITGLTEHDRVVLSTDNRTFEQSVKVVFA